MSPFAHRYINTRATLAVLLLLVALAVGLWLKDSQQSTNTAQVQATVVAADDASGNAQSLPLPLVVVELPDGSRVRLQAGRYALPAGDTVTLVQTTLADGSHRYRLQAESP
jgi:predicted component of type VI protein secretion system